MSSPRTDRPRTTMAVIATAVAPLLVVGVATSPAHAAPPPSTTPASVPVAADVGHPAGAHRTGDLAASRQIPLAIALTPRDRAGLAEFNAAVSNPESPQYRHFLTSQQYNDRYAPTSGQVRQVEGFLTREGLRVTGVSGNRQVVDATGAAARVQAAFGTTLGAYTLPSGRHIYAADRPASVPSDLAGMITFVGGLTDRPLATHVGHPAGSGPNGGQTPSDLQAAYSMGSVVSSYKGSGRSVGLLEFDAFKQSDIASWTQHYGLPSITPTVVPVDGGATLGGGQIEVTLDIDAVAVYAPAAAQYVYEAPNSDPAWVDEWNKIASDNTIDTLSGSWVVGESCESDPIAATHDTISQMISQGVTVLSASGDWGAYGCGYNGDNSTLTDDYPASDPLVTGVGGTHLVEGSGGSYQSESVWNSGSSGSTRSGGGYSTIYDTPDYQQPVNSNGKRAVPDVALAADPSAGGLSIFMNGGWQVVGGTSESSPLWAGFIADAAQKGNQRLGAINPTVYQIGQSSSYGADFHDVTQGTNGKYPAGTGYDLATGWGSIIGDKLIDGLLGGTQPPPQNDFSISLDPTSGSVVAGNSTTTTVATKVTNGQAENIALSASGLPSGASATFDPTSIDGAGSSTLTISTTSSTAAGTYNISVMGKSADARHSAPFSLTVTTPGGGGNNDIVNGGFETGTLQGWQSTGSASVVGSPVHGGSHAAQVGGPSASSGDSTLSQTFTAHNPTLTLYYDLACTGQFQFGFATITLTDNTTGQVQYLAQASCGQVSGWTKATGTLTNGDSFTVKVDHQGFVFQGSSSATYVDDVADASGPAANDFSLSLDPSSGHADPGGGVKSTVNTSVTSGSAVTIDLSASGLPSGASASFDPTSVSAGNSSTMTITTASSTADGSYTVTVTGTAGSIKHTATYTLTVGNEPPPPTVQKVSSDPYTNSDSHHATELESGSASFGNTIVAAFQTGRFNDGGSSDIGWVTSTDGGSTWQKGFLPNYTTASGGRFDRASDPIPAYDAKHQTWLISSLALVGARGDGAQISRSSDGVTWGNPIQAIGNTGGSTDFWDKDWIACDNSSNSPHYGTCYVESDNNSQGDVIYMTKSTDGGQSWAAPQRVSGASTGLGAEPQIQSNGTVIAPYWTTGGQIDAYTSTDGGQSWGSNVTIASINRAGDPGQLRDMSLPSAGIDASGKVYVAWGDCRFESGCAANDIVYSTSSDGSTWTSPDEIPIESTNNGTYHAIPALVVDPSTSGSTGKLGLYYYFFPDGSHLQVGYVSSANGGSSWSTPKTFGEPYTLDRIAPTSQGPMVGDYSASSAVNGNAVGVFAIGTAPSGGQAYDEAMYSAGGLPMSGGSVRATSTPVVARAPAAGGRLTAR